MPIPALESLVRAQLPSWTHAFPSECLFELQSCAEGFIVLLKFPSATIVEQLKKNVAAETDVNVEVKQAIPLTSVREGLAGVGKVKNIIAVASAKGGVGKSTTAVNLALALAYEGANVGLLDADIYGPSQARMLGVEGQKPELQTAKTFLPIAAHGIEMISMANLVAENTPMVWRGPMATGALQQLLRNTQWGGLDYLIVDMPPGTGDIQLTLAQTVPVSGAVIVTTPQEIALLDAKKGIEMFQKVNIPVLGVVENMAMHTCSQCGHQEAIFGEKGGERLAEEYQTRLLGRLPLQIDIREHTDAGKPPLSVAPDSEVSKTYRKIALSAALALLEAGVESDLPDIVYEDD